MRPPNQGIYRNTPDHQLRDQMKLVIESHWRLLSVEMTHEIVWGRFSFLLCRNSYGEVSGRAQVKLQPWG
jgi:hypothetical protein